MTTVRTALALSLAGSLLVLGACSDDDPRPKIAPPETSSPTASDSTSQTAEPSGDSDVSADAVFVRRYFSAVGESIHTGNTSLFLKMSSPRCQNCRTLAANIEQAFANDNYVKGGAWNVVRVEAKKGEQDAGREWHAVVRADRTKFFDGSGKLIKIAAPSTQKFAVLVTGADDELMLHDLRLR